MDITIEEYEEFMRDMLKYFRENMKNEGPLPDGKWMERFLAWAEWTDPKMRDLFWDK